MSGCAARPRFDVSPAARFRTAELSAYWSESDSVDWEGGIAYEALSQRARARLTHVRRLEHACRWR